MVQQELVYPTRRMSWLMFLPQLLNIPEAYRLQLVASAEIPTGWDWMAFWMLAQPLARVTPVILKLPPWVLQVAALAVQGQEEVLVIPWSLTQARALSLNPPLQPSFPQEWEQSTNCCSERLTTSDLKRAQDSSTATALKAQHDPQLPWFLMGDTFPWETQSTSPTTTFFSKSSQCTLAPFLGLRQMASNSASVSAVNWLTPILQVCFPSELCWAIISRFLRQISFRKESSSWVKATPKRCFHSLQSSFFSQVAQQSEEVAIRDRMSRKMVWSIIDYKSIWKGPLFMPDLGSDKEGKMTGKMKYSSGKAFNPLPGQ